MEMEALVEKIAQQVIRQLNEGQINANQLYAKKALVFMNQQINKQDIICKLNQKDIRCNFIEDFSQKQIETADYIIIPSLSIASLAFVANGIQGDDVSKVIIHSKLHGKEVMVLESGIEYKKFKNTSSPNLFKLYEGYQKKLEDYDIKIGSLQNLWEFEGNKLQVLENCTIDEQKEGIYLEDTVITEKKIKQLEPKEEDCIHIIEKAIITPMAKDFIRSQRLQIIRV